MQFRIPCILLTIIILSTITNAQSVLLIPDGIGRRVSAFSPVDGAIIDLNFVPSDPANLQSPFNAVSSGRGTLFISDVQADAVFEYSTNGSFIGTFADATNGLDEVVGIAVADGSLYVTVCGNAGGLADTIQRFDINRGSQTTWTNDETSGP